MKNYASTKRMLDIAASVFLLLLLVPAVIAISIAIAFTMGTPVMFRQTRPGWRRRPLSMLKFRTMTDARDADGELLPDEVRLTRLGRFLRDTSLDELPQLINVLLGDMSLIGPRPLLERYVRGCTPEQSRRFDARPGITGWAQIHGRKALDYDKRFEYDVFYVDNQSILFDIRILIGTLLTVLKRDGVVEGGEIALGPKTSPARPWASQQPSPAFSRTGIQIDRAEPLHIPEAAGLPTYRPKPSRETQI